MLRVRGHGTHGGSDRLQDGEVADVHGLGYDDFLPRVEEAGQHGVNRRRGTGKDRHLVDGTGVRRGLRLEIGHGATQLDFAQRR